MASRHRIQRHIPCGDRRAFRGIPSTTVREVRKRRRVLDMTEFEQLKALAAKIKEQKKTNLPQQELRRAVDLAASVLSDSTVELTGALETLDLFPAPVIAE